MSSGNGSEVSNWMAFGGALADAEALKNVSDINITLSNNITVAAAYLPTMTAGMGNKYLFDFTDGRFVGKTITIDGQGKTIKIDNARLFFLNLKNCTVILKNITIDGGWLGLGEDGQDQGGVQRSGSFIYVTEPDSGKSSELEIEEGTTIQNCKNSRGTGGAIYNSSGTLTINGGSITNCTAYYYSSSSGGAIYNNYGTVTINDGSITNCTANHNGGAIFNNYGTVTINDGSITNCTANHNGGAICSDYGTVTINGGSITGCTTTTTTSYSSGGAIYNDNGTLTINGGSITGCTTTTTSSSSSYGGAIYNDNGTLTINGGSITGCTTTSFNSYSDGGAIYSNGGTLTINGGSITSCTTTTTSSYSSGGAIYNNKGTLTINSGSITSCTSSSSSSQACGGAIYSDNGTVTINDINISDCKVSGNKDTHGGAIDNNAGKLIINGGSITNCTSQHYGDAIYNHETLEISGAISGLFKISLSGMHVNNACGHNDDPNDVGGYDGIYNAKAGGNGTKVAKITSVSNYKIDFVDSSDGSTVGFVFGKSGDEISVPDSVSNRPEYELTGLGYIKTGVGKTSIYVNEGKFKLDDDLKGSAVNSVIKVYVNYDKLYTVQYFCGDTVVGTKSDCPVNIDDLSDIINESFESVTLDGGQTLADVVSPGAGYTFSGFTYGKENVTYIDDETKWDALKGSAVDGLITVYVNYNKPYTEESYTVWYICDGKVVGRKSGCSSEMALSDIINENFESVTMDGSKTLGSVVNPGEGYTFSNFTYGEENKEVVLEPSEGQTATTWDNLKDSAVDKVITVYVNYDKPYTVQYIYDGKVVGTKSGCSAGTALSGIIGADFSQISLDDKTSLADAVKAEEIAGKGYTFSGFTYGTNNTAVILEASGGQTATTWQQLKDSAVNGVITVCVNYNKPYTVQYIYDGKVVGTKSGCSSELESLDGVVNNDLSRISLDDTAKLDVAVGDAALKKKGYTFSNFTYGDGQTYNAGTTSWTDLKDSAVNGVITVYVNYNKPYTVQYICDGKVVGTKSGCSVNIDNLSGIIGADFSQISLDDTTKLDVAVKAEEIAGKGYTFSGFTYGENNATYTAGTTSWTDLKGSAVNGVITVYVNYNKPYTVQYICDGKVVGRKSGCSVNIDNLSGIIGADFSQISLDDTTKLDAAVGHNDLQAKGYTFSNFTYGNDQTYTDGTTTWDALKDSAVNGVITVYVNYNKPYTVQYIYDGKVVGTKSGCSAGIDSLAGVVESVLASITLDGNTNLGSAVGDATLQEKGYTFSGFTYGDGQTYTAGKTSWADLKASAVDGVITVILNYTDCGAVKYVANGHMILDKKSKPTNYSGVNLPVSGLQKVSEPKNIIFDFCGQTIHHNDSDAPFIQGVPGKSITICNLHMDGSGCK